MSKKMVLILLLMASITLSGCGNKPANTKMDSAGKASSAGKADISHHSQIEKTGSATPNTPTQIAYKDYSNDRFGFSIQYPGTFITKTLPDNNDGIVLASPDNSAELTVSGINNVLNESVSALYEEALTEHPDAAYKTQKGNWFVLSWTEGDKIAYEKSVVGNGSINTFLIKYPSAQKETYNAVVSTLVVSFKTPGIETEH